MVLALLLVVSVLAPSAIMPPVPDSAPTVWPVADLRHVEGAAVDGERAGRRQRAADAVEQQRAGIDRGAAGVGVGGGEVEDARAVLGEAARAGDGAGERTWPLPLVSIVPPPAFSVDRPADVVDAAVQSAACRR